MSCPTDELLRAHVDVADPAVAQHADGCTTCARRLDAVRDDAGFAAAAVAGLDGDGRADVDVEAALQAFAPTSEPVATRASQLPVSIAAGVVALAVAVLLVLTPTGREAAADFLAGFRAERFEVVTFDPEQPMQGLEALGAIADVDVADVEQRPTEVDSLDAAAAVAGFAPSDVASLPDGATLRSIQASAPGMVRLRFRADQAPDLPAELDGATLVVSVPGAVASMYDVDGQALLVGEAGQLAVEAEGADLAAIRAYVLSRPEVPTGLAQQLLAIDDWTTTLPIPVPVDDIVWQDTTVAGAPGLVLSDPLGAGLLWQADGRIHAIGAEGGLDVDVLREIADGLR